MGAPLYSLPLALLKASFKGMNEPVQGYIVDVVTMNMSVQGCVTLGLMRQQPL